MVKKEQKKRTIHRVLIVLIVILAAAIFLELMYECAKKEAMLESQGQGYFVIPQVEQKSDFFEPDVDLNETESEYIIRCDLPGVDKDQVELSVNGKYLSIRGNRDIEKEKIGEGAYYYKERKRGRFQRNILLPGLVDEKGVRADYENGILVIRLPKLEPVEDRETKKIRII